MSPYVKNLIDGSVAFAQGVRFAMTVLASRCRPARKAPGSAIPAEKVQTALLQGFAKGRQALFLPMAEAQFPASRP